MISVRMFGPLALEVAGRRLGPRDLGGQKPKQVLEILLLERGRLVPKERLADHLWGDALPRNVAGALETYVSRVRRELHGAGRELVETEPGGYRIDPFSVDVDLDRFDALAGSARVEDHEMALELARGDVLEDEPYAAWALGARDVYAERVVRTLVRAAELRLESGAPRRALEHAERAVTLDAVRESAHRTIMRAHWTMGQQDQALRAFERCRTVLATELGVDPSPETEELHLQALRGETLKHAGKPQPPGAPARRAEVRADLPLLGRAAELNALQDAVRTALSGAPAMLLVEGEPGIGKSRLLDELVTWLERPQDDSAPVRIGRAKCFELDADLPYVPLAAAIRALVDDTVDQQRYPALGEILPELGPSGLPPETARTRALESVVELVADRSPVALVVDDLQWADPSTLAALSYLRRRGAQTPFVLLGACRSQAPTDHAVRSLRPDLLVELRSLTADDLAVLDVPGLYERTGGNPLFCVECMRAAAQGHPGEIPRTLRDTIVSRCRSAGPRAHRVLAVASVLGRSFDPGVLAHMAGADEASMIEDLELLRDHGLLDVRGERFDFRHDLIRETLAASLSPARRKVLHGRALSALERAGVSAGEMALHARGAGALGQAVRYAMAAGDAARDGWANAEAATNYELALRLAGEHPDLLDPAGLETLALRSARVLVTLGRAHQARELAERALQSSDARGDERAVFEALDALGLCLHRGLSRPSLAVDVASRALRIAQRTQDQSLLGRAHMLIGAPQASLGRLDEAMGHYTDALAVAERSGAPAPAWALGRMGLAVHHRARSEEAIGWCERAEAAALEQHDEETLLMSRWVRGLSLAALGRYREGWTMLQSVAGIGKGEEVFWHARFPNSFGSLLADCCLWERALEHDLASLEIAGSAGGAVREAWAQTILNVATDRLGLGDPGGASAALDLLRAEADAIEYARFRWLSRLHYLDSELALAGGDPEAALEAAGRCLEAAAEFRLPKYEVRGHLAMARALAAGGASSALDRAREAARLADRLSFPALSWRAWWVAAELSGTADDLLLARHGVLRCAAGLDDPLREEFLQAVPVEA